MATMDYFLRERASLCCTRQKNKIDGQGRGLSWGLQTYSEGTTNEEMENKQMNVKSDHPKKGVQTRRGEWRQKR
jgi:hypothetical protein